MRRNWWKSAANWSVWAGLIAFPVLRYCGEQELSLVMLCLGHAVGYHLLWHAWPKAGG